MIRKLTLCRFVTLTFVIFCGIEPLAAGSMTSGSSNPAGKYVLKNPEVFDLGLKKEMFKGRLASRPGLDVCHTQGLQVVGNQIILSCVMYDKEQEQKRSYEATGLLLQAKLSDIESADHKGEIKWDIKDITIDAPLEESSRISESVFGRFKKPSNADKIQYKLGHPSGMALSGDGKRVWVAPSVYGPGGYTAFVLYDPEKEEIDSREWMVPYHSGAAVEIGHGIVIGFTWGSKEFIALDTRSGKYVLYDNHLPEMLDYQDCQYVGKNTILCNGSYVLPTKAMSVKIGRGHLIRVKGRSYDNLKFELIGLLEMRTKDKQKTTQSLGFMECGNVGRKKQTCLIENEYGTASTTMNLTHEGMSFGPEKKYLYFVPDDLPGAKLIRYEATK